MNMGERISALLIQKRMTQKDLSLQTGLTESAISHYIRGDRIPRSVTIAKIAKVLGTTSDYLLTGEIDQDFEADLVTVKRLIARNATQMTKQQKLELVNILLGDD